MKAIISDIHGNLAALIAVLQDIDKLGITDIVCLGDIVGYGPEPAECLDLVKSRTDLVILGNHEEAVLFGATNFTPRARKAIDWTRHQLLEAENVPEELRKERKAYLESFKIQTRIEGVTYVHGSPRQPTREYVMPRDVYDRRKMKDLFDHIEDYCFCGHTHQPGVFTLNNFTPPSEMFDIYMFGSDEKALLNVGSVGQPRDGDPRACYITFDADTVVWRRVDYDVEKTVEKIFKIPYLERSLGERLREGK
ncbi:MAG: metallophosphoesterase family protein [Planctomycetota bacterium]